MNASTPIATTAQVALAIGGMVVTRTVFGGSLLIAVLVGVAASYPLTMLLVAVGRALADRD